MLTSIEKIRRGISGSGDHPAMVDPFVNVLERVRRLVEADCVIAFELDLTTGIIDIAAASGDTATTQASLDALAELLREDLSSRRRAVEVSRRSLRPALGEVLALRAETLGTVMVIAALRSHELSRPFTLNEERAVRRIEGWIVDYSRLWWQQRQDRDRGNSLHAALDLVGIAVLVIDGRGVNAGRIPGQRGGVKSGHWLCGMTI